MDCFLSCQKTATCMSMVTLGVDVMLFIIGGKLVSGNCNEYEEKEPATCAWNGHLLGQKHAVNHSDKSTFHDGDMISMRKWRLPCVDGHLLG